MFQNLEFIYSAHINISGQPSTYFLFRLYFFKYNLENCNLTCIDTLSIVWRYMASSNTKS